MLPVLWALPSKTAFALLVAITLVLVARDLLFAITGGFATALGPARPRVSSGAFAALAAAWLILLLRGGAWLPSRAVLEAPWPPIPIYAYATMLWLSFVAGWFVAMRGARHDGIDPNAIARLYVAVSVGSIVGARALFVLTNLDAFHSPFEAIALWNGGLVAYGGMSAGFVASIALCRRHRIRLLAWADVGAPAVALGTAITRIGCFLYGCDFGTRTGVPWAVQFPRGSPAWLLHRGAEQLPADATASFPVHPTQLYEAAVGVALFVLLEALRRRRAFEGQLFATWAIGYGVLRAAIEIVRGDDHRGAVGSFSTSQLIGVASAVLACALWIHLRHAAQTRPPVRPAR